MERIQAIPHILDEIALNLDHDDLATLARTSRAFFFAATANLWWTIDAENLPMIIDMTIQVDASRDPNLKKRGRLMRYRSCVRRINKVLQRLEVLPAAIRILLFDSPPLFPLANIISLDVSSPTDIHAIERMLAPKRLSISLHMDYTKAASWRVFFQSLLCSIGEAGGSLTKLIIVTPSDDPRYFDSWLPGLQLNMHHVFATLTKFTAPMGLVDIPLLSILSQAPLLDYLDIRRRKGGVGLKWDIQSLQALINDGKSFRSVKTAILRCDISSLASLMACIKGPLDDVQLKSEIRIEFEVALFAATMASIPSSVTKFLLYIDDVRDPTADRTHGAFRFELMETLHRCSGMSEFDLRWKSLFDVKFDVRDTHFARLAEAWPNLASLKMRWATPGDNAIPERNLCEPDLLTLAGLVPLARHCPQLKLLDLDYMSAVVDFSKPFDLPAVPCPRLELRIDQSSRIPDPTALGSLLDLLWCEIQLQHDPYHWSDSSICESSRSLRTKRTKREQQVYNLMLNFARRSPNIFRWR